MKDHKKVTRPFVSSDELAITGTKKDVEKTFISLLAKIDEFEKTHKNVKIINDEFGYDCPEWLITGWRPMTEKELTRQKRQRAKEAKRQKEKEDRERAERQKLYQKLKKEFE